MNDEHFLFVYGTAVVRDSDSITVGKVLAITENELYRGDRYEGDEYVRIEVTLESGKIVWMYIPG